MFGNYDTALAVNLMIVFEKCNNATSPVVCKSAEEIETWMEFKYISIAYNQKKII